MDNPATPTVLDAGDRKAQAVARGAGSDAKHVAWGHMPSLSTTWERRNAAATLWTSAASHPGL